MSDTQLVDAQGKPVKFEDLDKCPRCGGGKEKRRPSSGFGASWTVCLCGYEWRDKAWPVATL
jgi:hypothetical protein